MRNLAYHYKFSDSHYIATLLRSLAEAVSSNGKPRILNYDMMDSMMDEPSEDNHDDDIDFHRGCLEEIDRYRRMDEWIPSYNNVLSITVLDCKRRLVEAGAAEFGLVDFLQYTRDGTSDDLRLGAFESMMDLDLVRNDKIFQWFLMVIGTDPSPYLREHMRRLFGKLLAALAIGEISVSTAELAAEDSGLTIEQDGLTIEDTSTDTRKKSIDRKKTVPGALEALKEEIGGNEVLKKGMWAAISSPVISLQEMGQLLDICALLYTPNSSLVIKLKYPRYWKCRKVGKGKLVFSHTARVRTAPMPQRQPPVSTANTIVQGSISSTPAPMPPKRVFLTLPKRETPSLLSFPSLPSATSSMSLDSSTSQQMTSQTQTQPQPQPQPQPKPKLIFKTTKKPAS